MARGKTAFVTVGTTQFDALVRAVDRAEVVQALRERGFSKVTVQIGRGVHEPAAREGEPSCDWFRFKPNLDADMDAADLVISHAGAGSIMEALRRGKPLVVVVNEGLMDNHQLELAEAMEARGVLRCTTCAGLLDVLRSDSLAFDAYPRPDLAAFPALLNRMMFEPAAGPSPAT